MNASMPRELCILHANCQGEPLAFLLMQVPEFAQRYTIRRAVNYLRDPIHDELLAACRLFLYQPLGEAWDELASTRLLERMPQATALQLPNMFFKGYWPLWTNTGPLDFGDVFLDHLADQGLSVAEALHVCLHGKLENKYDLAGMVAATLAHERGKERLAVTHTADLVHAHWQEEQLFTSVNHPAPRLLLHVADAVLAALDMPPVPAPARARCPLCDDTFDLPIHPAVGRFFGLPFATEQRRYTVFGQPMTFAQYAACYLHCRQLGHGDFIDYLHRVRV